MNQHFGNKLQEIRKKNGLSQEALAEILEVSRQSVSKWESGQVYPEIDKIIFISRYFNISIDELLKDTPQTQQRKVINLSKPFKSVPESPVINYQTVDEDAMPNGYTPPVQPVYTAPPVYNNIHTVADNGNSKKKIKRKLGLPALIGLTAVGGLAIALVVTATIESYNSSSYTYEEPYVPYDEEIVEVYEENSAEYVPYSETFYYFDISKGEYIEVLLPVPRVDADFYGLKITNVYIESIGQYVDVIALDKDYGYSYEDVEFLRYYSEDYGQYMPVLMPPTCTEIDIESYGYDIVEVYDNNGEIYLTIIERDY